MRKVLIIHAHPEKESFCSSLKNKAIEFFKSNGAEVKITDLYENNFDPVGGRGDFKKLENDSFFKYQSEQVHAYKNDLFVDDLKEEMAKLEWCDTLIFNFPLWWFHVPAILKGWIDRVLAMGFVYGAGKGVYKNGIFKNKKSFLVLTTGGPKAAYESDDKNGKMGNILFPIQHGVLYFTGMTVLPPFVCYSPARISNEDREEELKRYENYLAHLNDHQPIYKADNN